ncbi:MAG: ABC transporter substrate-binding protein [Christensenellales bacterium]|jgi:NitT/TauT family transport system substrate-binding protein
MRSLKRITCLVLALLFCLFLIAGCGEDSSGLATIRVNEVTRSLFYCPQYAAIELGYFEEEGLAIDLVNGGGADKTMTAVLSSQADIGFCGPEASIYVYNEGKEDHTVLFAQLTKRDGSFVVGREDDDFSWQDLRGKTIIGGRKGGVPEMTLEYVLRQNGLEPGVDVEVITNIQFDLMGGAFEGGTGDYVTLFEPTASLFEKEGKGFVLASIGMDSGEIPYTAYMAKKSYIEKNPDIIQGFTNAVHKAQKWIQDQSASEIAKLVTPYFPDTDIELLALAIQSYMDADAWMRDPVMTEDSFMRLQQVITEAGELDQIAPYDKVVDTSFAKKAIETVQ